MEEIKQEESKEPEQEAVDPKKEIISWILYFAAAIVIALFLKNYVIINANIPSGSMENTIMTGDNVIGFRLSYTFSKPERGDIIIFKYPDDKTQNFVKRVIGLPGETVTIKEAKVYIDGDEEPLDESYLKEEWVRDNGPYEFVVPEGSYFVMGDNRNSSKDSRYWENTYVTEEDIIGKAIFVYFPFNHAGMLK